MRQRVCYVDDLSLWCSSSVLRVDGPVSDSSALWRNGWVKGSVSRVTPTTASNVRTVYPSCERDRAMSWPRVYVPVQKRGYLPLT